MTVVQHPRSEPMSWKMTSVKTILASKSLIKEFVEMEPAPHDRPTSERRIMVYKRIRKAGNFRTVTWASAHCHETNCVYRVNGKHTALMMNDEDPILPFHVTVERYDCPTLSDVANLYNTFDSNLANRSNQDVNLSFAATISSLKDVPNRFIHLTVSAAAFHKWDEKELKRVPPSERAEELLDRADFALWLQKVLGTSNNHAQYSSKPILRSPVVCAMMATYDKGPVIAERFWLLVKDESALDRDDPSRVLARWLVRATIGGGQVTNKAKLVVGSREMYVKCIHAWNAWRKGEPTNLKYVSEAPLPQIMK